MVGDGRAAEWFLGFPDYLMILHVKQEVMGNDVNVLDSVITSDKERLNLLAVGTAHSNLTVGTRRTDRPTGECGHRGREEGQGKQQRGGDRDASAGDR